MSHLPTVAFQRFDNHPLELSTYARYQCRSIDIDVSEDERRFKGLLTNLARRRQRGPGPSHVVILDVLAIVRSESRCVIVRNVDARGGMEVGRRVCVKVEEQTRAVMVRRLSR